MKNILKLIGIALITLSMCGTHAAHAADSNVQQLEAAAEEGDLAAMNSLGELYYKKLIPDETEAKAFLLFTKAAQLGHPIAQYNLGLCYEEGLGTEKDIEVARLYYKFSAEQGHEPAKKRYRDLMTPEEMHDEAVKLFEENKNAEAVELLRKSAEGGYLKAQLKLAECYKSGVGVEKNDKESALWYIKAANAGDVDALYIAAELYMNGVGVEKSEKKAFQIFSKLTERGDHVAQYKLGLCYENDTGVAKNMSAAKHFYRLSATQGNKDAQEALNRINNAEGASPATTPTPTPIPPKPPVSDDKPVVAATYKNALALYEKGEFKEAVKLFTVLAQKGDAEGQFGLGLCYEEGKGVQKSVSAALAYYRQSAAQGYSPAKSKVAKLTAKPQ